MADVRRWSHTTTFPTASARERITLRPDFEDARYPASSSSSVEHNQGVPLNPFKMVALQL
jgi:hypothetical protein